MSQTNNNEVVERLEPLEVFIHTHPSNKTGSSPTPTRYNIDGASFGRNRPEGPTPNNLQSEAANSSDTRRDHHLRRVLTHLKQRRGGVPKQR